MKKLFAKDKASIYGYLSAIVFVGFAVDAVAVSILATSGLPVGVMPITYLLQILFFASIVFGGLAVLCRWGMNKLTVSIIFVAGILLIVILRLYWIVDQVFSSIVPPPQLTNVVLGSEKTRNYNLGHGVVIAKTLCISGDPFLVDVYEGTKIYEQDGISQQKRQVDLDALQPRQVVDIKWVIHVDDPELQEFLYPKSNPMSFDLALYMVGATEITIHKGEFATVENSDCYGFMSAP
jgi:hypothetical protein